MDELKKEVFMDDYKFSFDEFYCKYGIDLSWGLIFVCVVEILVWDGFNVFIFFFIIFEWIKFCW